MQSLDYAPINLFLPLHLPFLHSALRYALPANDPFFEPPSPPKRAHIIHHGHDTLRLQDSKGRPP